jgi:hypothetical protein
LDALDGGAKIWTSAVLDGHHAVQCRVIFGHWIAHDEMEGWTTDRPQSSSDFFGGLVLQRRNASCIFGEGIARLQK